MNEEIDQQLQQIQPGDEVIIKGWEILNLKGWNGQEYIHRNLARRWL